LCIFYFHSHKEKERGHKKLKGKHFVVDAAATLIISCLQRCISQTCHQHFNSSLLIVLGKVDAAGCPEKNTSYD
jgi:hypothetical protein